MKKKLPVKPVDFLIILSALVLTGFSAYSVYVKPGDNTRVIIQGSGREWIFPSGADESIVVPGPLGDTLIRIQDNRIWVESSPCNNQICVAAGHIHRPGAWIACLPNNVFVLIEGTASEGPDSIAW